MASKGQKFIKYTNEEKLKALELASEKELTYARYALKININTLATWQFKIRAKSNHAFKPTKIEKKLEKLKKELEKRDEMQEVTKKFLVSLRIE